MLEDIGDVDTKSTFLPWQNMAARKMEAGFQFESAIAERELAVWCGELHRNQDLDHTIKPCHWSRPLGETGGNSQGSFVRKRLNRLSTGLLVLRHRGW